MAKSKNVIIVKYHSGNYGEWITLANITNTDINLTDWKMREYQSPTTVGTTWTFPSGTVIKAKSLLIVLRTNGSGITGAPANIPVVQSFLGPFGRDGEKIQLLKPSNQQADELIFGISSKIYSGPFQIIIPDPLANDEAFERKFVIDNDQANDWKMVQSPATIFAWEWVPLTGDIVPPLLESTIPADGATNVATDTFVKATFNEQLIWGHLPLSSVTIKEENDIPVNSVLPIVSGTELFITHADFMKNLTYTVNIPAQAVMDAANNAIASPITWSFKTAAEGVPPALESTIPAVGVTNVAVDTSVKATFSEPVFASTALQNVTIKDENSIPVEFVNTSVSGSELSISHAAFEYNKAYTVNIPANSVKDASGNANARITWSFKTSVVDIDPPVPLSEQQYPANGATNVDLYAQVVQHFNESLFPGPALGSVSIIEDATNIPVRNVQASISVLNDRALSIVHEPFEYNKTYTVNIPAQAVMDAAGNANTSPIEWSFTTMAPPSQTAAPVADQLSFYSTVPEYAQVYGAYGAVEADPWGTTVTIYSSAAKDTVLGTLTTINGSFWLTFNNSSSLQTVYVTATAPGKSESPVTPVPVSVSDTELAVKSIEPAHGSMNVALDVPIKVTFNENEPIFTGSGIQDIYIRDHFNGTIINVGGSVNGNELLIPHPTFMNSGYPFYDVFVPANAVTDTAGNPLATPLIWTFSTEWIFW